jgi:hypothetical protein
LWTYTKAVRKNAKRSEKDKQGSDVRSVSFGWHEFNCTVCAHPERQTIEDEWIGWGNTSRIAKEYHLSRDSIYRHAHALDLFSKRQRNLRRALERIIERAESVDVNASAVVAAIQAYAKINNRGQWIERVEGTDMNQLFEKMTSEELDAYARDGSLPDWFTSVTGEAVTESPGGDDEA